MDELLLTMQKYFGKQSFREQQLEAITKTLQAKHILCLFPTGHGKTIIYQLPAAVEHGVTLIFSPLCSLIADQVNRANSLGIPAVWISSEISKEDENMIYSNLNRRIPRFNLVFITPEKFNASENVRRNLGHMYTRNLLKRIVFDEAHTISVWGHSFRPDYLHVCAVRSLFPNVPIIALTATATGMVISDILHLLRLDNCITFKVNLNRPNLGFHILRKGKQYRNDIAQLILRKHKDETGIIFCRTRKETEFLCEQLQKKGINSDFFHAKIDPKQKVEVLQSWLSGLVKVVVATIAFGMGVDKSNVRFIIHQCLPSSAECYLQACGRAGENLNVEIA